MMRHIKSLRSTQENGSFPMETWKRDLGAGNNLIGGFVLTTIKSKNDKKERKCSRGTKEKVRGENEIKVSLKLGSKFGKRTSLS